MSTPSPLSPVVGEAQASPVERFRKRPLEVEMMLWDGSDERLLALERWCGNLRDDPTASPRFIVDADRNGAVFNDQERDWIKCPLGHRVAMGALGEFYPVSPAAIAQTFDPAPEPLELTPAELAGAMTDFHFSTCDDRERCPDCARKVKEVKAILGAASPVIAQEAAEEADREADAFYVHDLCSYIYEHADTDDGLEDVLQFSVEELTGLVYTWQPGAWENYLREREPARFANSDGAPVAAALIPTPIPDGEE